MSSIRTQVWSSGGGVQSNAIAVLIIQGKLPKPDLAVISDTEYERSTTWKYMEQYTLPALREAGVELHRVKKSDYATVDLYRGDTILIPAYTTEETHNTGKVGKLPTYCSNEWKQRVVRRWCNDQGVQQADIWIGMSTDEMRRLKTPTGKWQNKYPLIDLQMNRADCLALVERHGWPLPPRSACYMCPQQSYDEWQWQKQFSPADHEQAVRFEGEIQKHDEHLHLLDSAEPLSEVDFAKHESLPGFCQSGYCFT